MKYLLFVMLMLSSFACDAYETKQVSYTSPSTDLVIHALVKVDCDKMMMSFVKVWTKTVKFFPISEFDLRWRKISSTKLDVCPQTKSKKKV